MARDIGKMGESFLESLCHQERLKVNKSGMDDSSGWDYVIESPHKESQGGDLLNFENDFSKVIYKFQVKATESNEWGIPVKLSNMQRFVNDPTPAFFIFFKYSKNIDIPINAYLVHVGRDLISKTIKRLRQAEVKNKKKLHKQSITIKYDDTNRLESLTGKCLFESIQKYVGLDCLKYAQEKIQNIKTVGYDGFNTRVSFKTSGIEELESLVNTMLGIKDEFRVEDIVITNTRFGIDKKVSSENNGVLSIKANHNRVYSFDSGRMSKPLI